MIIEKKFINYTDSIEIIPSSENSACIRVRTDYHDAFELSDLAVVVLNRADIEAVIKYLTENLERIE